MCLSLVAALGLGVVQNARASEPAGTTDCPGIQVRVQSGPAKDRAMVCDGANRAVVFLLAHGLGIKDTIRVELRKFAMPNRPTHIGSYDAATRVVELLTYEQTLLQTAQEPPFETPMDEQLYISFATHEVAHAIAHQNFRVAHGPHIGHEYMAYVAQISTMEAATRDPILQKYRFAGFANADEMSWTYYALNPSAFAVKAYRHYLTLTDKRVFLMGLLSGDIRPGAARRETW